MITIYPFIFLSLIISILNRGVIACADHETTSLKKFIVEFRDPASLKKRSNYGDASDAFLEILKLCGISASLSRSFSSDSLFHGISFKIYESYINEHKILQTLMQHPDIKMAWPVRNIKLLSPQFQNNMDNLIFNGNNIQQNEGESNTIGYSNIDIDNFEKNQNIGDNTYNNNNDFATEEDYGGKAALNYPDYNSFDPSRDTASLNLQNINGAVLRNVEMEEAINRTKLVVTEDFRYPRWNPHVITGVDKLHQRGLTGKGVTVAVIDSGVDYTDIALGSRYGPGSKISGGWNFVGDVYSQEFEGYNTFSENNDVRDCYGHGTHVTGILCGADNPNFIGVAPGVTVRAYKIFGCVDLSSDDAILSSMIRAYTDNVDIVSMSLGIDGVVFDDSPLALVAGRMTEGGVFMSVSAGNGGTVGPYFGNAIAAGKHVTSVAASSTGQYLAYEATVNSSSGESYNIAYIPAVGVQPNITGIFRLRVFNDTVCNLAGKIPENTDGQQTALLFPKGKCNSNTNYYGVSSLGYPIVLTYDDEENFNITNGYTLPPRGIYDPISLRGSINGNMGRWIQNQFNQDNDIDIILEERSLVPRTVITQGNINQIQPSTFSSWGPTYSGNFYPHVTAPGSSIYSTYKNGTYAIIGGTSMATPYVCTVQQQTVITIIIIVIFF